jgi:hypothetical protein
MKRAGTSRKWVIIYGNTGDIDYLERVGFVLSRSCNFSMALLRPPREWTRLKDKSINQETPSPSTRHAGIVLWREIAT